MKNIRNYIQYLVLLGIGVFAIHSSAHADSYDRAEMMVRDAFEELLNREPYKNEYRKYASWTVSERADYGQLKGRIARDFRIQVRESAHQYSTQPAKSEAMARMWVNELFMDVLGREPGRLELQNYATVCFEERYTKHDLRSIIAEDYDLDIHESRHVGNTHNQADFDEIIRKAYRDILERDPDEKGYKNYRRLMVEKKWSESKVRKDIERSKEALWNKLSTVVVRAYEDLLDRTPSVKERDHYVGEMIRRSWDERTLRNTIKKSTEYKVERPRRMINLAYETVLLRKADTSAFSGLTKLIVKNEWSQFQVEAHLRKCQEYQNVTIPKMVTRAYSEVLKRKPDPSGERFYLSKARQGWTFEDIKTHMRDSEEYKERFN